MLIYCPFNYFAMIFKDSCTYFYHAYTYSHVISKLRDYDWFCYLFLIILKFHELFIQPSNK